MHLSAVGLELMKKSEGFRNQTYRDVAGVPTIGYGHRLLPGEFFPNGISEERAADILSNDVCQAEQAVARLVKVPLAQGQFDALVDFVFNLGAGRLAASALLRDLNAGRYDAAAGELLRWDHAGKNELSSLKNRREAELRLWSDAETQRQTAA